MMDVPLKGWFVSGELTLIKLRTVEGRESENRPE